MKNVNIERFEKGPKAEPIDFVGAPIQEPPVKALLPVLPSAKENKALPPDENDGILPANEKDRYARTRANSDAHMRVDSSGHMDIHKQAQEDTSGQTIADVETDAEIAQANKDEGVESDALVLELRKAIKEGTVNNQGIRFSQREADDLRDVGYEIATRYRFKLSKNDMIRLGLDYLLAEYRRLGEESVLAKFVIAKRDLV